MLSELVPLVVLVLYLAIVCWALAALVITLSRAKVFRPMRTWLKAKAPWVGSMVSCPYCLSHWVAFGFLYAVKPMWLPVNGGEFLDGLITWLFMVATIAFFSGKLFQQVLGVYDTDKKGVES